MDKKPYLVGICQHCHSDISSDSDYTIMEYSPNPLKEGEYLIGPVHAKCRIDTLLSFIQELKRTIKDQNTIIELLRDGNGHS